MIDILNQRVQMNPEKTFFQYKNQNISYKQFNNIVDNISNTIKLDDLRADYIGLQIIDKLRLLGLIIALNRNNKIPVLYPNYPNIQDYVQSANIPITFKDNDISINTNNSNENITNITYNEDSTQVVIFTSGTTGTPKACRLTYKNIYQSTLQWNEILKFNDNDIFLNHMPIIHVSGLCIFFRALYYNFKMILDEFNSNSYLNYIQDNKITLVSMVPNMLQQTIDNTSLVNIQNNLKAMIISGAKISSKNFDIITKYQIPAYIAYGMSETTSGIAGFWYNNNKPKYYIPHRHTHINLYESKIKITGDTVMKGYLNERNLDGTFISNDIGEMQNDLSFKIKKRHGSISNYGGEIVSKEYIKNHIEQYAAIDQCTLKTVRDANWGEALHAYIKLKENIDGDTLLKKIKQSLPKHMIPKKIIIQ